MVCFKMIKNKNVSPQNRILEDGLLVVTSVGDVVYRNYGTGQSSDAHSGHGGFAQVAVAHHTPFGYHSHRIHLKLHTKPKLHFGTPKPPVRRVKIIKKIIMNPAQTNGDRKSTRRPSDRFVSIRHAVPMETVRPNSARSTTDTARQYNNYEN